MSNPKYLSKSTDDETTVLQRIGNDDDRPLNNNPNYFPNMIDMLNTPFDHIERIVLQDLSNVLFEDGGNYFKHLFSFPADSSGNYHGGFAGFTMEDVEDVSDFGVINDRFKPNVNASLGGFFVDSFTYTPFVDYS